MNKSIYSIIGIALSIIGIIAGLHHKDMKKLLYYFSKPTEFINYNYKLDDIDIMLNNKRINNANGVTLTLWNHGNSVIRDSDISNVHPLKIVADKPVDLHLFIPIVKSRNDLKYTYRIIKDKKSKESIELELMGDEALEVKDGFSALIVYGGENDIDWSVQGHIIGYPHYPKEANNISVNNWRDENIFIKAFMIIVPIILVCLSMSIGISLFINDSIPMKNKILWGFAILFALAYVYVFFSYVLNNNPFVPIWANSIME